MASKAVVIMAQPHASQFSGIFVSYRRDDSSGHAGRLFDNLSKHFGENQIFMDIDTIEPGEDFVEVIEKAVGSCEIVIAVMGKSWLSSSDGEFRRLDNPNDFVRLEIATALKRGIRVIPVLVQKATMPRPQELPDDIAMLSRRNAIELSDSRWQYDVTKLVTVLERVLAARQAAHAAEAAREEEEERFRQEEEQRRRAEEDARRRLAAEEIERKAAEERRREEQRRAEEEKKRLTSEAEERRLKAERIKKAEEIRRVEDETRQRLAEEAKRRADEQRRIEEEIEQKSLEAKSREAERRLAEETANRAAAEEKRLVEEKALEEKRLTELEAQRRLAEEAAKRRATEEKRLVEEKQLKAAEEKRRVEAEATRRFVEAKAEDESAGKFVEASSAGAQPLEISAEVPAHSSVVPIVTHSTPEFAEPSAEPETKSRKTILIVAVAATVLLVIVTLVFMLSSPNKSEQVAPNVNPLALYPPSGMVYVPGGEFMMGRNGDDPYESPAHKVTVKPFFMDVYEVTCEDFQKFLKNHTAAGDESKQCDGRDGKIPVTGVTWDDANAYAKALGKRLPTETEWEFAARGTDGRPYPWGFEWLPGRANAEGSSGLTPVGTSSGASPFGAFDMVGNAWEWTSSSLVAYPGGKLPKEVFGDIKIIRGGSYDERATEATTTYRGFVKPAGEQDRYVKTGFRCVKDINE